VKRGGRGSKEGKKERLWLPGSASLRPGQTGRFLSYFPLSHLKTEAEFNFQNVDFIIYTMDKVQKNSFTYYNVPPSENFKL
jgi:hypothetical protein